MSAASPRRHRPTGRSPGHLLRLALAFFAIYVVWGSTYLAIRYAVEAIPPLTTAGLRHLVAGGILFAHATGRGLRATRHHWRASLVLGALFFLVGHGALHWAEQIVPSGLAALIIATEPVWIALLFALPPHRRRVGQSAVAGLILGLLGVALLMRGDLLGMSAQHAIGGLAVLASSIAWSAGVCYSSRARLPTDPLLRTATTLLAGSALLLGTAVVAGEPARLTAAALAPRPLLALLYLIVFGSLVAYTAYMWLLERCSPTLVATHTYVNPVVAMLLGWAIEGEPLTAPVLAAAALILTAVVLVGRGAPAETSPASRADDTPEAEPAPPRVW
ncbi:MAG TPA: EamA family transporter [Vicinamibacterales bacterium]|nr:EamA family transporter [Vicinamibacterales bacterium]